jgi:hypothetical protein
MGYNYGTIPKVVHYDTSTPSPSIDDHDDHRNKNRITQIVGVTGFLLLFAMAAVASYQNGDRSALASLSMLQAMEADDDTVHKKPHYFHHAIVDHLDPSNTATFTQRYYEKGEYFGGPGSPLFLIFGGEDPLLGLLYPFIYDHLARDFSAYTFALEHRFFGTSLPVAKPTHRQVRELLTPKQALWDAVTFIQYQREQLGCSLDRTSPLYCPVITVGGSYPGFLSALMRFAHPDIVDISYAASAPLNLYSHHVDQFAYYDKVTSTADEVSPGCADATRSTLLAAQKDILNHKDKEIRQVAKKYGICLRSVPKYIQTTKLFSEELMMIIVTHFANYNMDYYPPGPHQDFEKACHILQDKKSSPENKIAKLLALGNEDDKHYQCFDMMTEVAPKKYGQVSASDWSGVGAGPEGYYWDFISCQLIPECGTSKNSLFPERRWDLKWTTDYCMRRFGWKPDIHALNDEFGFDDRSNVTHLLFTNGIVDGWSVASVTIEDGPGIRVVNMVNGAHHSDLSHQGPSEHDTPDVKAAFVEIESILEGWLNEIRRGATN